MPVEAGRELAEEVDVGVPVEIGQIRAFAFDQGDGKRVVVQHRARVAAGHVAGCGLEAGLALRIGCDVAGFHVGQGGFEIEIAHRPGPSC